MLKPLKIVGMLALTVIGLSIAVFYVEGVTSDVIAKRKADEMALIIESLSEIFPSMESTYTVETAEPTDDSIKAGIDTTLEIYDTDGNAKGYVYFVTFNGFANKVSYMLSIDAEGNIGGFEMLSQKETASTASEFMEPSLWEQFQGMSIQVAGAGDFDGVSGATYTTTFWKSSMQLLYEYHLDTYGFTPLTAEQVWMQKLNALAGATVTQYTNTNPYDSYGITNIYATEDESVVVYVAEFFGYEGDTQYAIAYDTTTNEVLGYVTNFSDDTAEYGAAAMLDSSLYDQFNGTVASDMLDVSVDTFAGASDYTAPAFSASLQLVATYHRWEFEGEKVLTYDERVEKGNTDLFSSATTIEDVTIEKGFSPIIQAIYDAYEDDTYLGTIYRVATLGASVDGFTYIEFMVGIDSTGNYTGIMVLASTDDGEYMEGYLADGYGASIIGDSIDDDLDLDGVSGSTVSFNQIKAAIEEVVAYHNDIYPLGPTPGTDALIAAFPGATVFVDVYADYTENDNILNIFEAQNDLGDTLGYVYYAVMDGFKGQIVYTLGVDTSGVTQQFNILSQEETWSDATHDGYDGSAGTNFASSTWLATFEGIQISEITLMISDAEDANYDGVSGVSETTTRVIDALQLIAAYHADESVGGAN